MVHNLTFRSISFSFYCTLHNFPASSSPPHSDCFVSQLIESDPESSIANHKMITMEEDLLMTKLSVEAAALVIVNVGNLRKQKWARIPSIMVVSWCHMSLFGGLAAVLISCILQSTWICDEGMASLMKRRLLSAKCKGKLMIRGAENSQWAFSAHKCIFTAHHAWKVSAFCL